MFEGLYANGNTFETYEEYLNAQPIFMLFKDEQFSGFFTMSPVENERVEIHLYILPKGRTQSMRVMRTVIDFTLSKKRIPITTVSGDYPHIIRCLKMLGSEVVKVDKDVVNKNGNLYDLYYLENRGGH